jgi:hypothetical protein
MTPDPSYMYIWEYLVRSDLVAEFTAEFESLDSRCEDYTDTETKIGTFSGVGEDD